MLSRDEDRFLFPAWALSLAIHGVAVGVALTCFAQIKSKPQTELFQWNVALAEATKPASRLEAVQSGTGGHQPPTPVVPPPRIKPVSEQSRPVMPIERKIEPHRPTIESVHPMEPMRESSQIREEPVERRFIDVVDATSEPVTAIQEPEAVADAPTSEPGDPPPVPQEPVASAATSLSAADEPLAQEAPALAVAPTTSPDAKEDHRWLAESLWRRVAELKRYPQSARLNGQEGKVVLKAVIRSDGELAEVLVLRSSGYEALDRAAIEAVRLACPLHMKYAIGKPRIVVTLPIVYSLAN
jgi:protein TonB